MKKITKILLIFALVAIFSGCADKKEKELVSHDSSVGNNERIKSREKRIQEGSWYKPKPGISWQWQLQGEVDTKFDVDMYDVDLEFVKVETIDRLHEKGIEVVCYFSAGSWEDFRSDAKDFSKEIIGEPLDGWPDEHWLDISNYEKFANIMTARLDVAVTKGCDGVDPDNVHAYQAESGFEISYEDQLIYNKWLASEAHKRNLSIGLKYDIEQVDELVDHFDFAINENCFYYRECDKLLPFVEKNKAVFGVEYELETNEFCDKANKMNFSWLRMEYDLNGGRNALR